MRARSPRQNTHRRRQDGQRAAVGMHQDQCDVATAGAGQGRQPRWMVRLQPTDGRSQSDTSHARRIRRIGASHGTVRKCAVAANSVVPPPRGTSIRADRMVVRSDCLAEGFRDPVPIGRPPPAKSQPTAPVKGVRSVARIGCSAAATAETGRRPGFERFWSTGAYPHRPVPRTHFRTRR